MNHRRACVYMCKIASLIQELIGPRFEACLQRERVNGDRRPGGWRHRRRADVWRCTRAAACFPLHLARLHRMRALNCDHKVAAGLCIKAFCSSDDSAALPSFAILRSAPHTPNYDPSCSPLPHTIAARAAQSSIWHTCCRDASLPCRQRRSRAWRRRSRASRSACRVRPSAAAAGRR